MPLPVTCARPQLRPAVLPPPGHSAEDARFDYREAAGGGKMLPSPMSGDFQVRAAPAPPGGTTRRNWLQC